MDGIDITLLQRKPEVIKKYFTIKNDITYVNKSVTIVFPERYIDRKLAILDTTVKLLACHAIIDEDLNYTVVSAPIIQILAPSKIGTLTVGEDTYKTLEFEVTDEPIVYMPNNNLAMSDSFIYNIFDEFFIKGKVPFFLTYHDISDIFKEAKKYAGANIGTDPLVFEFLSSVIARDSSNKKIYTRLSENPGSTEHIDYVGLNNPFYSFDNTAAKIIGSRFKIGLNTALVEPETKTSRTIQILKA